MYKDGRCKHNLRKSKYTDEDNTCGCNDQTMDNFRCSIIDGHMTYNTVCQTMEQESAVNGCGPRIAPLPLPRYVVRGD